MNALIRNDAQRTVTINTEAKERARKAIEAAQLVTQVTNGAENASAVAAQAELLTLVRETEKGRKEVKAPVLDFGALIDLTAKQFIGPIQRELDRIKPKVDAFQAEQARKQREAEEARRREQQRIEQERQTELARIASEEERKRKELADAEAEAKQKSGEAKEWDAMVKADAEAENLRASQQAVADAALVKADEANRSFDIQSAAVPVAEVARARGQIVRTDWSIVVVDAHQLAVTHPECVTITPRLHEIKRLLDGGVVVAGVRAERVTNSTVRTARSEVVEIGGAQ